MAGKKVGKFTRLWVEGDNVTTVGRLITPAMVAAKHDVGGYTQDMQYLLGRTDTTLTLDGIFSDDTSTFWDALVNNPPSDNIFIVSWSVGDNALPVIGDPTMHISATNIVHNVTPDPNGIVSVNLELVGRNSQIQFGTLLADATINANGSQSSHDNGASTANGAVGILHVTSNPSGEQITSIKIEDSPNNSVWSDLITFTMDGSPNDAERIAVTGTIDRYTRLTYTVSDTGNYNVACMLIRL